MAILGAGLTAGATVLGSLLGGLFSSKSQSSANQTNLEIARETNQQNRDLFEKQLAWTEDMWNKTNEYNSPKEVVQRMRQAGVNPALGAEFGTASSPGSPSAPTMQAATVNPVDYSWIGNSVSTGVNAFYNNNLTNAATRKTTNDAQISKVNAEMETAAFKDRLMQIANDSKKSEYERDQARLAMELLDKTQADSIKQASWMTKIQEQEFEIKVNQIAESKLQQQALQIANEYAPKMNQEQLNQYKAAIANLYASARAGDAQAAYAHAQEALTVVHKSGAEISNRQAEAVFNAVTDKAWAEADNAYATGEQIRSITRRTEAESRKLGNQDRYGELGYRTLGSALPETERRVKQGVKLFLKGKKAYDRHIDHAKRRIEERRKSR